MYRFFENLVDPYTAYEADDTPPQRLWPFIWGYSQPFKRIFLVSGMLAIVGATVEIGLIHYMGRVVDILSAGSPAELWARHGWELIGIAAFILILRPLLQALEPQQSGPPIL